MSWYRPNYTLRLSPRGTARITFPDGTCITLMRQRSAAQALRTAWRLKKGGRHA